jgi:prepilin-type N-terminal cleavage/methylation domain-containing protein
MPTERLLKLKILSDNRGFTLLELMVVVAVLGILTAIAIQQFATYRSRAVDTQMRSDLKNAAMAMESYFAEYRSYPGTVGAITAVGFRQTNGVSLTISISSPSSFILTASKPSGTQPSFTYDSSTGLIN